MATLRDIRYSYADVPTIREFAASDAFVRGLMGAVGSGKSSGSVIEIPRRAMAQAKGPDGVRRSRWVVIRNCFDDQTEILTENCGWKLFKDLNPEEKVAALHGGKELVFETPTMHYCAPYCGEMVGIKGDVIDFLVTPDHHLWTSKRQTRQKIWSEFSHERASDAFGRSLRRFKRDSVWLGGDARYSVDFYRFFGFWYAEGYAGAYQYPDRREPHWRFVVVQKHNLDKVRGFIARAGLEWSEGINEKNGCTYFRIRITDALKPLIRELAAQGGATRKFLSPWMKDVSAEHAAAFLEGFIFGDGHERTKSDETTFACTSSKQLADDLQEMAVKAGLVANVGIRKTNKNPKSFTPTTDFAYVITFMTPSRSSPVGRKWYKVDYDAMVYCVEVSSHVVLVRRNGKAHWSGQTYGELRDTTIKTFFQWLPPEHFGKYNSTEHTYNVKAMEGCDFEVMFRALDRPDDVKKLLSMEVTGAWINEAREVPWAVVDLIQTRLGRYPAIRDGGASWSGVWMDTNPPDSDSKWYKFFEESKHKPGFAALFKQPSGLAPTAENLLNLPGGRLYYDRLSNGKSDEWIKVYVHGEYGFVIDGRPVFPEYNDRIHCQKVDPISGVTVYRGFDFGLTPACCFSQILPDGRWLIFDEMTSENMGVDRFSDEVLEHCARAFPSDAHFEDYGDPAGQQRAQTDERTCFEILHAKGIMIEGGEQNLTIRLESVRKPLRMLVNGEPQFIIHPRCKMLRKALMGAYQFRRMQTTSERYTSVPDKNSASHIADAMQYVATRLFGNSLTRGYQEDEDDFPQAGYSDAGRSAVTGY